MLIIHFFAPQFFKSFNFKILLIVLLIELVNSCSEFTLIGDQFFLKIFGNNDLAILLYPSITMVTMHQYFSAASNHIRYPVFRIIDFLHHQSTIILSYLGVKSLGRSEKDIALLLNIYLSKDPIFLIHL